MVNGIRFHSLVAEEMTLLKGKPVFSVLRECTNVELSFSKITNKTELLRGANKGTMYLTPYRMVFVSTNAKDSLGSVMFPFYLMKGCSIEQPVFAVNYIRGTLYAEPGGGWEGQASFKMAFLDGGAIDFGQHIFKLATNVSSAPSTENGDILYGYPSPLVMNGYPYTLQHNSFNQGPPTTQGTVPYPHPAASSGVHPSIPNDPVCMLPRPPYPRLPLNWAALPPPENPKAAVAAGNAYYNPRNPHKIYIPVEQPPPYSPHAQDKKTI